MIPIIRHIFAIVAAVSCIIPAVAATKESQAVRGMIEKVNNRWQSTHSPETWAFWDEAAYHTGNMEAYFLTGNDSWRDYSEKWAEHNEWKGAKGTDRDKWKYTYGETDDHVLFGDWQR